MQVGTGLVALVADDDADVRALLVHQLRRWGFTTHEAVDGHEAITAVTRLSPHLLLLDVDMPGADGLTVLAAVRREQAGRPVQSAVLLVTAQASGDDVARGLAAGADDYVRKPFHLGELQQRVSTAVSRARRLADLESVRAAVRQPRVPSRPGLDVAATSRPVGGAGAGGDLIAVVDAPDGHVVAVLGDAMGHGPAAAAHATYTRTLLSSTARFEPDPGRVLALANNAVHVDPDLAPGLETEFVTACVVSVQPATGLFRWASAGHSGPWQVEAGAVTSGDLDAVVGPPLGLGLHTDYPVRHGFLRPGGRLLLHSDALAVRTRTGADFLDDVLPGVLARGSDDVEALLEEVAASLAEHDDGRHPDDTSLLVLGRPPCPVVEQPLPGA